MKYNLEDFVTETDVLPGSLTDRKVIFINGPPRSGKDTLGNRFSSQFGTTVVKMAETLKKSVYADFGLPLDLPIEFFDSVKDIPLPIFDGLSFREACIEKSEERTKPWRGPKWFGQKLVSKIRRSSSKAFAITDSGFAAEAEPVMEAVGADNCLLLRIHAEERGVSFAGDSRSYIQLPVLSYDLYNNVTGDTRQFFADADEIAREFLFGAELGHFVK